MSSSSSARSSSRRPPCCRPGGARAARPLELLRPARGHAFLNVSTFNTLQSGLDTTEYNRLVWTPDVRGSICFLVSGVLAFVGVRRRPRRSSDWLIAAVNLVGCVAFGISAIASYVVPCTGSALDLAAANAWTAFGTLCFLVGAVLLARTSGAGAARPALRPRSS